MFLPLNRLKLKLSRQRKKVILAITVSFLLNYCMVKFYFYWGKPSNLKSQFPLGTHQDENTAIIALTSARQSNEKLLVDTSFCKIRETEILPLFYKNNTKSLPEENINNIQENCLLHDINFMSFANSESDEVIEFNHSNLKSCTFWEIKSDPVSDNNFVLIPQTNITKFKNQNSPSVNVNVGKMEMFMGNCGGSYNFEARIPMTQKVMGKIKFWEKQARTIKPKPTNILIIGIDTTSRLHAYRSLPKTLRLFKEMGFLDFRGYHSIYPGTRENFNAFLMGYTSADSKKYCQRNWRDSVDSCPFIWKGFQSQQNYVTMFVEDWVGTFNWGNQGGFKRKPVDYYIHPLFLAREFYGRNQPCLQASTSTPKFLLSYTERFLRKFNRTAPFFSFTWMGYPFHDDDSALSKMDEPLQTFFHRIKNDQQFLDNSLIIFLGDHGDRYGPFSRSSTSTFESFSERSLPPLFIRIPQNLKRQFPHLNIAKYADTNTRRLTTPFDVHKTLLQILELNSNIMSFTKQLARPLRNDATNENTSKNVDVNYANVDSLEKSRGGSLFSFISENRTCELVGIPSDFCVCNLNSNQPLLLDNSVVTEGMLEWAVKELNSIVQNSKYFSKCHVWTQASSPFPLGSAYHLRSGNDDGNESIPGTGTGFGVVLLKFMVLPDFALFQIQVKVLEDDFENQMEVSNNITKLLGKVGEISRISSYGDSSWCVLAEDKYMKEFCQCLEDRPETYLSSVKNQNDPYPFVAKNNIHYLQKYLNMS